MQLCPCGITDHQVTPDVAASVATAIGRGAVVSYDPRTGQHRWTAPCRVTKR